MSQNNIVSGGKNLYGAAIGILMLETSFPRIPGDIGNAQTWPFPVLYKIIKGGSFIKVIREQPEEFCDAFVDAAKELVHHGADGITTNCGFLAMYQSQISEAVGVPVATSSLMQVPMVQNLLPPDKRVGVITVDSKGLGPAHFKGAGIPMDTPLVGTENGKELTRAVLELDNNSKLNMDLAREDLIDAARRLLNEHENIGAIVLECTNMVPYATDVREAVGLPVFSIYTYVKWLQESLMPTEFSRRLVDQRDL